jgi:hypothetical protein
MHYTPNGTVKFNLAIDINIALTTPIMEMQVPVCRCIVKDDVGGQQLVSRYQVSTCGR